MGVRNSKKMVLQRTENKTLDARFLEIITQGLNCSNFEAQAVLDVVHEVYYPYLDEACTKAPPGKVTVVAVSADEPAGKKISECAKVTVCLTVHRGSEDDRLLSEKGPKVFRRSRLADLCQQALSQGALLTREDLAHHVFYVSTRTISRDLAYLRKENPLTPIPLRSTVQDIGPVLTHRVWIVQLVLEGKTMSEICQYTRHSPAAVANYQSTFARCAFLAQQGMEVGQIAFLLRRGRSLIRSYMELLEQCGTDRNKKYHLDELLRVDEAKREKKIRRGWEDGREG